MLEVNVTLKLSNQLLTDVLVTAFEGGSNYWYDRLQFFEKDGGKEIYYERGRAVERIIAGEVYATFCDIEDHDEQFKLDLDDIKKNIGLFANLADGKMVRELYDETYDAGTADVFLQISTFGKLVYG